ncbi:MAG: hypothetical protein ABSA52_21875, partial [Candidatus Binatia bacterium]
MKRIPCGRCSLPGFGKLATAFVVTLIALCAVLAFYARAATAVTVTSCCDCETFCSMQSDCGSCTPVDNATCVGSACATFTPTPTPTDTPTPTETPTETP